MELLIKPKKIRVRTDNVILIPYIWSKDTEKEIVKSANFHRKIFRTDFYEFNNLSVITGFMGYSEIISILHFFDLRDKNIYFTGTAGALSEDFKDGEICSVNQVSTCSSFINNKICAFDSIGIKPFNNNLFRNVIALSVDILQRETDEWFMSQKNRSQKLVEMELFALSEYFKGNISALLIVSDFISLNGQKRSDIKEVIHSFERAYNYIKEITDER